MDRKRQREMTNQCYRKLKHKSNRSELKKSDVAANDSGKSRLNEIQTNSGMFTYKNKAITELKIAGKSQLSDVRKSSGMFIHKNKENSNFDPKSKTMVHAIDSQLGNQHRSRQYLFHLHYRKYPTKEQAINHPPEGIKARDWVLLCEKFASEQFQKMSARNKVNRAANELPPTVGSRSVARTIDMKRRKGEEVTLIDHFGIAHYSEKKKEMVSEKAKEIWTGIQNDATTSSSTPAEICLKWLKRVPGHLKGRSAPKKEILANVRLREQVEHERKRAEASEEKVEQLTETCSTLLKENKDIKRKMGYVLDQLAHFTGVQIPQEFDD